MSVKLPKRQKEVLDALTARGVLKRGDYVGHAAVVGPTVYALEEKGLIELVTWSKPDPGLHDSLEWVARPKS